MLLLICNVLSFVWYVTDIYNFSFGYGVFWKIGDFSPDSKWRIEKLTSIEGEFPGLLMRMFSLPSFERYKLVLPLGWPIIMLLLPSSILFWRRLFYPKEHCQSCGYNLQGNITGICPECGTVTS